ncbi:MAG: hypothetical protein GY941_30540 [Planctomycetes bacterium]|nr:hypothetical protein [Planctomycetota bacterium]
MENSNLQILPDLTTQVAIVGGGMAGLWAGYKLAKNGISSTLITYLDVDRGGVKGSTSLCVAGINYAPFNTKDQLHEFLKKLGYGQIHPSVEEMLSSYFQEELEEVVSLFDLKPIKIGASIVGGGKSFLNKMSELYQSQEGTIINGWVTRLVVNKNSCQGIQYESQNGIGKLRCQSIILASGGYTGLYKNSIKNNNFGRILGDYLRCGGSATNLEFTFKHAYVNIDACKITPTETLPGAEVYKDNVKRIEWLERLLFNEQGTDTHLDAVKLWRDSKDTYYIDLSYRQLYLMIKDFNKMLQFLDSVKGSKEHEPRQIIAELLALFDNAYHGQVQEELNVLIKKRELIDYNQYNLLKKYIKNSNEKRRFRVSGLTYFSMGGIAHNNFSTNLPNVYVTGEVMHDYGANRVGGLPWSLYLTSGRVISDCILKNLSQQKSMPCDFDLVLKKAYFDKELLLQIQSCVCDNQDEALYLQHIPWFQQKRHELLEKGRVLDDSIYWLTVAEAIVKSIVIRKESRGCFRRREYPEEDSSLQDHFSYTYFMKDKEEIAVELLPKDQIYKPN